MTHKQARASSEALQILCEKYPDLRIGQILVNVARPKELFYMSDEDLTTKLCVASVIGFDTQ